MPLLRSTDPLRKIPFIQLLQAGVGLKEAYKTTMRVPHNPSQSSHQKAT
ncbi:MAG: hypothetical protein ACRYG7_10230 [Janthinobacterium lividum]